jgi:predicted nucleotidyltransferase
MDILSDIAEIFRSEIADKHPEAPIVAAYLFGSFLKTKISKSSDIDLAFLLDEVCYNSDPIEAMSAAHLIAVRVGMKFDKETDVTILNSASLEIAYEVVSTAKCIYELNSDQRLEYEAKIRGMYFDFKPFLEELRARSLAQV